MHATVRYGKEELLDISKVHHKLKYRLLDCDFYYIWTQPTPAGKTQQHRLRMSVVADDQCIQGEDEVREAGYMPD